VKSASARYDGHADWYDEHFSAASTEAETRYLRESLGAGGGAACLDVACGTGRYAQAVADAGYRVAGFDVSADQLSYARRRVAGAVRADARLLPVRDQAVAAAVGMFFHTDVEDFGAVIREVARCLRPRGRFVYIGVHPCFVGPFVYRMTEAQDGALSFVSGYGATGWANRGSGDGTHIGGRVGFHHKTLGNLLQAITSAGLVIRDVREFQGRGIVLPWNLGLVAERA